MDCRRRTVLLGGAVALALLALPALAVVSLAGPPTAADDAAIRKVMADYARAIETKDLALFKTVKPNLSKEESDRLQKSFSSIQSQVVVITIQSVDVDDGLAIVRTARRDTIDRSLIASFPQTLIFERAAGGWVIRDIKR